MHRGLVTDGGRGRTVTRRVLARYGQALSLYSILHMIADLFTINTSIEFQDRWVKRVSALGCAGLESQLDSQVIAISPALHHLYSSGDHLTISVCSR